MRALRLCDDQVFLSAFVLETLRELRDRERLEDAAPLSRRVLEEGATAEPDSDVPED